VVAALKKGKLYLTKGTDRCAVRGEGGPFKRGREKHEEPSDKKESNGKTILKREGGGVGASDHEK